jgi:hypothetical protein
MRTRFLRVVALVVLGSLPWWGTGGSEARTGPQVALSAEATGSISGQLFEDDGVTPLPYGWVMLFDAVTWGDALYGTSTGPDGRYTFDGLADGAYRLEAMDEEHERIFYPHTPFFRQSTVIEIVGGEVVSGIDVALGPSGYISGRVVADDGTPLPAINVVLADAYSTDLGGGAGCSNEQGEYLLAFVPLGYEFKVYAGSTGNWCDGGPKSYEKQWWPYADHWADGGVVSVSAEAPRLSGIDFRLGHAGAISGHVGWTGSPTPVFPVPEVYVLDAGGISLVASVETAANGEYVVRDLPVGSYLVYAEREGYAMAFYNSGQPYVANATPVQVYPGGETGGIDLTLEPGGTVSGQVRGADGGMPLAGVSVSADGTWLHACSAADGRFTVAHVPLGEALTYVAGENTWCAASGRYWKEWWQEADNLALATPIVLSAAAPNRTGIAFTLERLPPAAYLPVVLR